MVKKAHIKWIHQFSAW